MMSISKSDHDRTVIIKRNDLLIDEKECQVVSFIDITTYKMLQKEKERSELLKTMNTTVHHEMLSPLHANVVICRKLIAQLENYQKAQKLVQIMLVSS